MWVGPGLPSIRRRASPSSIKLEMIATGPKNPDDVRSGSIVRRASVTLDGAIEGRLDQAGA
jgi:hypothetical protein